MRRRDLLGSLALLGVDVHAQSRAWPFDAAPSGTWSRFPAAGFSEGACGLVFRGAELKIGVPLGGLGTGYMTIEGDGKIGTHSIYNDLVPPKKHFADWLLI